ncbi:hypothetical protein C8D96_1472 [Kushneria marisflavi]|nr:hypothetical protein C8D96_1472 [Kushneria marisflavi]
MTGEALFLIMESNMALQVSMMSYTANHNDVT